MPFLSGPHFAMRPLWSHCLSSWRLYKGLPSFVYVIFFSSLPLMWFLLCSLETSVVLCRQCLEPWINCGMFQDSNLKGKSLFDLNYFGYYNIFTFHVYAIVAQNYCLGTIFGFQAKFIHMYIRPICLFNIVQIPSKKRLCFWIHFFCQFL